jgi:hypothetical protein
VEEAVRTVRAARDEAVADDGRAAPEADWGDPEHGRWRLARLEQAARDVAGVDPRRSERLGFYLEALRPLAGEDGLLPASVDPVVSEAFDELLP